MSIFDYQAAIKITFDKPIVTDPEIVTGIEGYSPNLPLTPISWSASSEMNPKEYAYDNNPSTYWIALTSGPNQWIAKNFGVPVEISRISYRSANGYRANGFKVQASVNGSTWVDILSSNFENHDNLQTFDFTPATYQYWRIYCISVYSYWWGVGELSFQTTRNTYSTAGWTVTGSEYAYQPEGAVVAGQYTVRKVTKSEDDMSVILWLDMFDRMRDPAGLVTVAYDKLLGNLIGPYSAAVESFSIQFSPADIIPYSNPYGRDNLSVLANMTVGIVEVIYKYIPAESNTFLVPDQDNPYMDEHLSAQANMTVVVTKVGDLPL